MRNTYLPVTLMTLLGALYSPVYGAELPSKYAVPDCKINMLSEPTYNSNRSTWIGMTAISGCKTAELSTKD